MGKTLVVLGILCLAAVAMADVSMDFTVTKDAGIDASYGEHHNRGGDTQFRFAKGVTTSGEFGIYDFDRTAIQNFVNANLGGQTLQQAIDGGKITVNFSLVTAVADADPNWQVGVMDVYTADQWVEGNGTGVPDPTYGDPLGTGDDSAYNWPGALAAPFPTAVTLDAPADYLGLPTGLGGGNWSESDNGFKGQQFKNLPGTANSAIMTGWAQNARTSVPLDDSLWCEYIFGVSSSDTGVSTPATGMLKTYGFSWDPTDPNYSNSANMCCFSKESGAATAPKLTVTITGVTPQKHPGDANNDGAVDVIDLGILARNYDWVGTNPPDTPATSWLKGDFNGDLAVDVIDLGILARNYDWVGAPAGAVPEPLTLSLLAVGAAALIRRRK